MAFYLSILKAVLEVALLALAAQALVGVFNWGRRHSNVVYQVLGIVARPFVVAVRWVTPSVVMDRHIPIATFLLLVFAWFGVGVWKISACNADLTQPSCAELRQARTP